MSYRGRKPWSSEPYTAETDEQRAVRNKIFYFGVLVVFLFGILSLQLARMQLVNGDEYRLRAETNRLRLEPIMPARGLIYDRNGVPLVENIPSYAAAVVVADIPQGRDSEISIALQELTGRPAGEIMEVINQRRQSNDPFTPAVIEANLKIEKAFALREQLADLPGVRVVVEPQRRYLEGQLLSHVLGFVGPIYEEDYEHLATEGYHLNDVIGKAGVEFTYESLLRGETGSRAVETDASGREIQVLAETAATPGLNVVLSIDTELQRKVEEIVRGGMGASLNAAAVVMDVHTGEVLSLVSLPNYDSNAFVGELDQRAIDSFYANPAKPMLNHAIAEMYAPGSTFKQITGLAALQEGLATAGTEIFSPGYLDVENEWAPGTFDRFKDWRSDLGTMNFYRGLAMSSDVYFYYLSGGYVKDGRQVFRGLGSDRLADWARSFGLGAESGIDLPGESDGLVPDSVWKEETIGEPWVLGDTYNFGIGQGYVAATPIQMVRVTAAVANGGKVLIPHVVKELTDAEGNKLQLARSNVARTLNIDQRNLNIVKEGMRQVVDGGSGYTAAVRGVTVAGKTGTAEFGEQRPDGSYKEHGWFTAFAPYEKPEIAVVVFLEQGNGSGTAAPTAAKIIDYYFNQRTLAEAR